MATASPSNALKFRLSPISTVKASCERFMSMSKSGAGKFRSKLELVTAQVEGTTDQVHIELTLMVSGIPKDDDRALAFQVSCHVDTNVLFDRPQSDELPGDVANHIGALLFQVAAERCRTLISTMGYPGQVLGATPPPFAPDRNEQPAEKEVTKEKSASPEKAPQKAKRARRVNPTRTD